MKEKKPEMEPVSVTKSETCQSCATSAPIGAPPSAGGNEVKTAETSLTTGAMGDLAPALALEENAMIGASTWQNNKQVTALWSLNQNCNAWAGIGGIGWKKLANNSNTAVVALNMLCAHAREKSSIVNYREENGMIREIYVG